MSLDGFDLNTPLAITLYVPDASVRMLGREGWLRRCLEDGGAGLEFVVPGWWEGSHTVRLGPATAEVRGAKGEGRASGGSRDEGRGSRGERRVKSEVRGCEGAWRSDGKEPHAEAR